MRFYIPFGDWSGDGHERYEKVLVEAESMKKNMAKISFKVMQKAMIIQSCLQLVGKL